MRTRLSQAKQDRLYLKARRGGMVPKDIATRFGVSLRTVYYGIERARLLERPADIERPRPPKLVPLFPLTPLTPFVDCPHRGPIRKGSIFCCMVCNRSGMDHHRALRLHPSDPKPRRRFKSAPSPVLSRKERRSALRITSPGNN